MEEHRGGLALLGPGWSAGPGPEWSPDRPLRVVAVNCLPYISVEQRPDGSLAYSNSLFQLWQIMAEELGLSYEMVAPLTDGFGTLDGNGTWIGVIGDLVGGRADLALQRLGTTPDRIAAVDFLNGVPFDSWSPTFFVRRDIAGTPPLSPGMFASLLRPLGADVWWTLAAALLALSLVLRLSLRFNSARAEDGRLVRDMGWGSCLFAMALTVLGQGWHRTPRSLSGRTATIIGWFLGILIFINYTANLMSFLAVPRVVRPISSVREFVEQPDWTLAMYSGARKLDELRSSLDPDERELYRRSITGDRFVALDSVAKGDLQTLEPKLMIFGDFDVLYHFFGEEACNYVPLHTTPIKPVVLFMAIPKGRSAFKKAITKVLLKLYQTGLVSRLIHSVWKPDYSMCAPPKGFAELSIHNLMPVFCLLLLGIVTSLTILAMELFLHKMSQRSCRQK